MSSAIHAFRERVVEFVRTNVSELREVDWYDGLFDAQDIREWSLKTPCAFVAATNAEEIPYDTGEVTVPVDLVMVVITQDNRFPRDADKACWDIIEKTALLMRLQTFGDERAGPAHKIRFKRLKDPVMRRENVAIGVVTWCTNLTLGTNRALERDSLYDIYGHRITQVPPRLSGAFALDGGPADTVVSESDTTPISPPRIFRDTPWNEPGVPDEANPEILP